MVVAVPLAVLKERRVAPRRAAENRSGCSKFILEIGEVVLIVLSRKLESKEMELKSEEI